MNILFVCTGNIFRSMSAEHLAQAYLKEHDIKGVTVRSAGTSAKLQVGYPETFARLDKYNASAKEHKQRKISRALLDEQDVIICMTRHHQETIRLLGYDAYLYKELSEGVNEDVYDEAEYGELYGFDYSLPRFINELVDYLYETIPAVLERLQQHIKGDHKV